MSDAARDGLLYLIARLERDGKIEQWTADRASEFVATLAASQVRERALAEALEMERDLAQAIIDEGHDTGDLPRRWWLERIKHMSAALAGAGEGD